ncbi:response regulator transcription factor [Microvirga pudoricolor]|uniref:response regulator transcription factor n=1 Tax=Microvirga pudoricolor TaxID=2778729 RepID=UPI001950F700|nr:response regulator [Microvirga pudoricolor]MBM6594237.1 response regulator [Microvirga pudoricolor]
MPGVLMIAIVDDDESAREAAVDLVKALGFRASGFGSAASFLESEDLSRMDCLIADVRMPGMSGLDLHLTLAGSGVAIPTILMTAYPDEYARRQALVVGVKRYIRKPLEPEELLSCIRAAVGHAAASGNGDPQPS